MQRRTFIKQSCLACVALPLVGSLIESCTTKRYVTGSIHDGALVIPLHAFEIKQKGKIEFRNYVVAEHPSLQFPICVFRKSKDEYTALWMRCPHQGAELQVFGDKLQCPAHGSEFNKEGHVQSAPATDNLRTFKIKTTSTHLNIALS